MVNCRAQLCLPIPSSFKTCANSGRFSALRSGAVHFLLPCLPFGPRFSAKLLDAAVADQSSLRPLGISYFPPPLPSTGLSFSPTFSASRSMFSGPGFGPPVLVLTPWFPSRDRTPGWQLRALLYSALLVTSCWSPTAAGRLSSRQCPAAGGPPLRGSSVSSAHPYGM